MSLHVLLVVVSMAHSFLLLERMCFIESAIFVATFALGDEDQDQGVVSLPTPPPPLLYSAMIQVTKGKNRQQKMEAMLRLLAETSAPIEDSEKDELLHHMSSMYKVRTKLLLVDFAVVFLEYI